MHRRVDLCAPCLRSRVGGRQDDGLPGQRGLGEQMEREVGLGAAAEVLNDAL